MKKKSIIAALMTLALISTVSADHSLESSPVVGNETPENNSEIGTTISDLNNNGGVDLGVEAYDPVGGDVNVTFYNAEDDTEIGTDTEGTEFNVTWDVDEFKKYEWYAVAKDNNTNTTNSGTYNFELRNTDSTAPSITFNTNPSGTILNREISVEGTTDERARIEYKLDDGSYQTLTGLGEEFDFSIQDLSNGDHTVTVRATDQAGNSNTESFSFREADGSEVTFDVNVDRSYPQSGIPIDPDSSVFSTDVDVDFDFTLEGNGQTYDISNNYQDGVCDFRGDEGWNLGGNYFCGTEVPENIQLGEYDLVVEWDLRGDSHRSVLDSSFPIEDTATWYSSSMSHGGRVEGSVNLNTEFTDNYETYEGQKVACTGNTFRVNNIQQVTARCSNGASSTSTPPIVTFVNRNGQKVSTANNNMFGDSGCAIGSGVTRQQLFGTSGLSTDDKGYRPQNCNLDWQLGGDSSFNVHTFNQPGDYNIFVDYPNAISNSPDYICPARTDNNNICNSGSISGDETGWNNVKTESVKIVNPEGNIVNSGFGSNVVRSGEYIRRKDYSGDITGTVVFENTGTGKIDVSDLEFNCPSGVTCNTVTDMSGGLEVDSGDSLSITWVASPDGRTTGPIDVELSYDDVYGLSCSGGEKTQNFEYYLDEANPDTEVE